MITFTFSIELCTLKSLFIFSELPFQAVFFIFQPADWEEREYIEDPNQVKPEVGGTVLCCYAISTV